MTRRTKLMVRWSLVTAGLIALFWTIYYFVNGCSVPDVSTIRWTSKQTISLPSPVSRWWDILIGPIYSIIVISVLTSHKKYKNDIIVGLVLGLIIGLAFGLFRGLGVGLGVSLAFVLFIGLGVGLGTSLGVSLAFGLVVGLFYSLAFGLGVSMLAALKAIIGLVIQTLRKIFSKKTWIKAWDWLMVRG